MRKINNYTELQKIISKDFLSSIKKIGVQVSKISETIFFNDAS